MKILIQTIMNMPSLESICDSNEEDFTYHGSSK